MRNTLYRNIAITVVCPVVAFVLTWLGFSSFGRFSIVFFPMAILVIPVSGAIWANLGAFPWIKTPAIRAVALVGAILLQAALVCGVSFMAYLLYVYGVMSW